MKFKTIRGYCETQGQDYSVTINIVETQTLEGISRNYGTYKCPYKKSGNSCSLSECSILKSVGVKVGGKA